MKFCGMCGAQMPDEAVTCTNCGAPLPASQVPQQPDYQQQAYQQPDYQQQAYQQPYQQQAYGQQMNYQQPYGQQPSADPSAKGKAVGSLVCGIIGLVFGTMGSCLSCVCTGASLGTGAIISLVFNLIGLAICIVGIVLAVKARNTIAAGVQGRGMATAGLVCSIIATVFVGIAVVCSSCTACAQCSACAGMNGCTELVNEASREASRNSDIQDYFDSYNW